MGTSYLPRLDPSHYCGTAVVHWTLPIALRAVGWLTTDFHAHFREIMLHASAREHLFCPVYCLMPDHIHLVWMGTVQQSDQQNAMRFLRTHLEPYLIPHRFQHQAHDHVLREAERARDAFTRVCSYILQNPVRAELVADAEKWPFLGTLVPGYPRLHPCDESFWDIFWKLYHRDSQP